MTRGVDRILKILEERGIRATFFTPGWVAEQYPDKLKAIVEKGHEIAALGYHHEHMALLSEEEQESAIKKGIDAIEKVCGVTPKGFRSPEGELTLDTLRIAKKNGLVYSSNLCDDDRPYWKDLGEDKILEIPIHWVNYDLPYFAFNYHPAFRQARAGSQIIQEFLTTGRMNFSDAMNTASVMSFSWIRQPSEHRAGSDFWKSFWIILKPLMVYGGQPVRKCMTTA